MSKILIVEDDKNITNTLTYYLQNEGFKIETAKNKNEGIEKIKEHAYDFINKRLAPASIPNDGKQTPMRGHPVFIAEHATATCCRGCLYKWHKIPAGIELNKEQKDYIVNVIMAWIDREIKIR